MNLILDDSFMKKCPCGKAHITAVKKIFTGKGAVEKLSGQVQELGVETAYFIADEKTYAVAGDRITRLLADEGLDVVKHVFFIHGLNLMKARLVKLFCTMIQSAIL